jgi:RNA-directed DNA polymerase
MEESHIEGLATHDDPESCAVVREGGGEALTGAHAGGVLSREIVSSRVPTLLPEAEGHTDRNASASSWTTRRGLETPSMRGISVRENREIPESPDADGAAGRAGKAKRRTPAMHDTGKSDSSIVPAKPPNKTGKPVAEVVEGRGLAKDNAEQQNAPRTQCRTSAPNALERVRQAAKKNRKCRFTNLLHHVTVDLLRQAFGALRKKAAPGVDGVTWAQYGENLEANLQDLYARVHRGAYRAKPSRRAYILKADGRQRPLGIAALEDKLLQRAVGEVLQAIYEVDFLGFSYGFRPGRSQHHALDALVVGIERQKVNWVLDADIRGFFDAITHEWLMKFLEHRIADRRLLRLIQKWLNAGVMEDGKWNGSDKGTPQGANLSPLLANIYLHYVLDLWVQQWRKRQAQGDVIVTRYADDFIVGFQERSDAERFLVELRERLHKFSLDLHPEKTRLIEFGRFAAQNRRTWRLGKPETFNFLGFTHVCARTRTGTFQVRRRTMSKRMRAKLQEVKTELRRRWHLPISEQGEWLGRVVRGYFAYHAVPNNGKALKSFRDQVLRHWLRTLRRRSQRDRMTWKDISRLSERWIPKPKILHPWPNQRFAGKIRGRSPVR